ncbi:hypothetical protein COCNU_contig69327147G000010 [Cocos nucifera]|nr:hypothetical protein [Cocos nucifera]
MLHKPAGDRVVGDQGLGQRIPYYLGRLHAMVENMDGVDHDIPQPGSLIDGREGKIAGWGWLAGDDRSLGQLGHAVAHVWEKENGPVRLVFCVGVECLCLLIKIGVLLKSTCWSSWQTVDADLNMLGWILAG